MSVKVKIPTQLRSLAGGSHELEVNGSTTLADLFNELGERHRELVERVLDEDGQLRRFINVYVGDEDVRFLEGLATPLSPGAVVSILPAVAGGSS